MFNMQAMLLHVVTVQVQVNFGCDWQADAVRYVLWSVAAPHRILSFA